MNKIPGQYFGCDCKIFVQRLHGYPAREMVRRPALSKIGSGNRSTSSFGGGRSNRRVYFARNGNSYWTNNVTS